MPGLDLKLLSWREDDHMRECLFCSIVVGDQPSAVVLRTQHVVAFLDTRPVFKGHVLVVPQSHVSTLTELPAALVSPLFGAVQRVASAVVSGLGAQGSFVAMNNTVSQSVAHLHVHVIPRTKGDGLRGFFWPRQRYEPGEMQVFADTVVRAIAEPGATSAPSSAV